MAEYHCLDCPTEGTQEEMNNHCKKEKHTFARVNSNIPKNFKLKPEAIRDPVSVRFDILYPAFLRKMAEIGAFGAEKYGDLNWQKSRLEGGKGPVNHLMKHTTSYLLKEKYDHPELGTDRKIHLAAIAFNAMMEYWYEENS
jgi:hypothetical protein